MIDTLKSAYDFNIKYSQRINTLLEPFKVHFGIEHFAYAKFYNNGGLLRVSGNERWSQQFFLHEFYNDQALFLPQINQTPLNSWCHFLITGEPKGKHLTLLHDFGIWHVFHMYRKTKEATELYVFSANRENEEICNYYLNNIPILKQFILHFKNKCADILTFSPSKVIRSQLMRDEAETQVEDHNTWSFAQRIPIPTIKKFFIDEECVLTLREFQVAQYLLTGQTLKEISLKLGISPRTMEIHLASLKNKTNTMTKAQLIKKLKQLGVIPIE